MFKTRNVVQNFLKIPNVMNFGIFFGILQSIELSMILMLDNTIICFLKICLIF
jgi:lipoprotein signal peptidase